MMRAERDMEGRVGGRRGRMYPGERSYANILHDGTSSLNVYSSQ
jgi:hypothetical protein